MDQAVPGTGPVLLEIGSGRGRFSLEYAEQHPDHRVLALEIRLKYAALLAEKFQNKGLSNARCYAGDARTILPRVQPDGCIQHVAIHFPDPWWKKRHAKRLVVGDDFVQELLRLVTKDGLILVQTDVEHRAREYLDRLGSVSGLVNVQTEGEPFSDESPFAPARSNREYRAIEDGLPIYRLIFRRV
jgi:tRNA (guanine-N7-)-methyltransferase